jgi:hypothetical protein
MKVLKESRIELARLITDNPDLPIKARVDSDVIFDDCYSWFLADVKNPRIETYWEFGDVIYDDEDNLLDAIEDVINFDDFTNPNPSEKEIRNEINKRFEEVPKKKAIFITVEN